MSENGTDAAAQTPPQPAPTEPAPLVPCDTPKPLLAESPVPPAQPVQPPADAPARPDCESDPKNSVAEENQSAELSATSAENVSAEKPGSAKPSTNGHARRPRKGNAGTERIWPEHLLEAAKRATGSAEQNGKDIAGLRAELGDLKRKLEEVESQSRKATEELQSAQADIEKRKIRELDLRAEIDAAKEANGYTKAALKDETSRREQLETQLKHGGNGGAKEQASKELETERNALRQQREELEAKLAVEQEAVEKLKRRTEELDQIVTQQAAEYESAKLELQKQTDERVRSESALREQLDTAWFTKKELEGVCVEGQKRFEDEVAKLRQEHEEAARQLSAALEREKDEQAAASEQLTAARAIQANLEKSLAEALDRIMRAEQERDDLQARLAAADEGAAESARQIAELHSHLDQNTAELQRLTEALEKQAAERDASEARWREQHEAAKAQSKKLESEWSEAVQRNVQFETEMTALRQECEEFSTKMQAAHQAAAEANWRADDLERCLGRKAAEIEALKGDVAKKKTELYHLEAESREQLENAKALAKKLDTAWTQAVERNRGYEAELDCLRQERDELQARLLAAPGAEAPSDSLKPEPKKQSGKRRLRNEAVAVQTDPTAEPAPAAGTEEKALGESDKVGKPAPAQIPRYDFVRGNRHPKRQFKK